MNPPMPAAPTARSGHPPAYHALVRSRPATDILTRERDADSDESTSRIRCPLCEWQPTPSSLWYCLECPVPEGFSGGCGTAWNTFETHGVCPGCQHRWHWTSCHACLMWSRHDDWYEEESRT